MSPKLGIIIFARMSSSRLPGKMLSKLGGLTLLERVIQRARCVGPEVVLATSDCSEDDQLCAAAAAFDVPVFRGSLHDVMGRAVQAAQAFSFTAFARLCGDRPLFPIDDMRRGLSLMANSIKLEEHVDLVTTHLPQPVPAGLTTEIIQTESLARARSQAKGPQDLEHVTTCFYHYPERFTIVHLETSMRGFKDLHFAIDRPEDSKRIDAVFSEHASISLSVEAAAKSLARMSKAEAF